jgi:molecular chaperone DnaK
MSLGHFRLDGIPPAPRGVPQIEVTFDIDANGIINVTALDKATGKEQKVTITASTNLDKGEIESMVRQARDHEAEDRKRREMVEARNNADSLAYQTEKMLKDLGDKVPANERQNIQSKVSELREALKGDDIDRIKRLSDEIQNAFHALSQQLYAQQGEQAGGPQAGPFPGAGPFPSGNGSGETDGDSEDEGEVIEGEYREA